MNTSATKSRDENRFKLRTIAIGLMTLLSLALFYFGLQNSLQESIAVENERDFRVTIPEQADGSELPTFKARQGDQITIHIRSDVMGEANLHGYEKKISLRPGHEGTLSFTARKAGTYPLHLHQAGELDSAGSEVMHRHLAAVEIHPH